MKLIEEFKKFAVKGNVVDLAVAVVIGGAFGKIVSSFVDDIIMPLLGALVGGVDFSGLQLVLHQEAVLKYGNFLQTVFNFLIIAWSIFMAIKIINKLKKEKPVEETKPSEPSEEVKLLAEIRDLLKK